MNIDFSFSPYKHLLNYKSDIKVNKFLIKILYFIYFFTAKDYIKQAKYIIIPSLEVRDLANYYCGLLKYKYNLEINLSLYSSTFGMTYIPSSGEFYNLGLEGKNFGNKLIDAAFWFFKRGKAAGLPPSL